MVKVLSKTLKWPLISLFITASFHFASVAIWPEIRNLFIAPTLAPMVLAYGIWVGYTAIRKGGNYFTSIIAALILGMLPLLIETFCFGMILHLEGRALVGLFALSMILFGSLIGGGFALSNK